MKYCSNKNCSKDNPQNIECFYIVNNKMLNNCKECIKEQRSKYYNKVKDKKREYNKQYSEKNKEQISKQKKEYYILNQEQKREYECKRRKNKEVQAYRKKYAKDYQITRRKNDLNFRLTCSLRTRLWNALHGKFKTGSFIKDLGCTIDELKIYLEQQFKDGMTWNNYGNKEGQWSLDHIIPLSRFDLTIREQFLKAAHYTNLQPMWHIENIKKNNKI